MTQSVRGFALLAVMVLGAALAGCVSSSRSLRASPPARHALQAERLEITNGRGDVSVIENQEVIDHLAAAFQRAEWDPTPITIPAGMVTIRGIEDGVPRFQLLAAGGILFDVDLETKRRRLFHLADADTLWLERQLSEAFSGAVPSRE